MQHSPGPSSWHLPQGSPLHTLLRLIKGGGLDATSESANPAKDHHFSALRIIRYSGPIQIIPFFRLLLKKAVYGLNDESLILFY